MSRRILLLMVVILSTTTYPQKDTKAQATECLFVPFVVINHFNKIRTGVPA
jgi:hypothetical protein